MLCFAYLCYWNNLTLLYFKFDGFVPTKLKIYFRKFKLFDVSGFEENKRLVVYLCHSAAVHIEECFYCLFFLWLLFIR